MPTNAYERGQRAKRRGKLLEQNPFAKRKQNRGNIQKTNDWALGWHSAEFAPQVPSDWTWPPLVAIPRGEAGDYDRRETGLRALMRPKDLVDYDVLRAEMLCGVVVLVPEWARVPYGILWAYAASRGNSLGEEYDGPASEWNSHPMKYLLSSIRNQGGGAHWPPLVVSAYEELYGSVFEVLRPADSEE